MTDYDLATWGALAGLAVLALSGAGLMKMLRTAWQDHARRTFEDEVWYDRCILVYFLAFCVWDGQFAVPAQVLFWFLALNMALLNPWYCRRKMAEAKR